MAKENFVSHSKWTRKVSAFQELFEVDVDKLIRMINEARSKNIPVLSLQVPPIEIWGVQLEFNPLLTRPFLRTTIPVDGIQEGIVGAPKEGA